VLGDVVASMHSEHASNDLSRAAVVRGARRRVGDVKPRASRCRAPTDRLWLHKRGVGSLREYACTARPRSHGASGLLQKPNTSRHRS